MILVDTGILAAFVNSRDQNHSRSEQLLDQLRQGGYGVGIVTDYVLDEVLSLIFVRTRRHELCIKIGELIISQKIGKFLLIPDEIVYKSWDTYKKYVMKGLSFTDCSIIATAGMLNSNQILSFDKGFDGILDRIH